MKTTLTKRAQTAVPSSIRKKYGLKGGDCLEWVDDGTVIRVVPLPSDPVAALRGCAKGERLTAFLLEERRKDRGRE